MTFKPGLKQLAPLAIGMAAATFLGIWLLVSAQQTGSVDTSTVFYSPLTPIGNPQIQLAKTVSNSNPQVGDIITYTLTYQNINPGSQAFNVALYEFLPAGVQYLSAQPNPDSFRNGALIFNTPVVGPSTDQIVIKVRVRVLEGYETLQNKALVTADGVVPPNVVLQTDVTQPPISLRLVKSGYSAVLINDELVYTLMAQNTSNNTVNDTVLIDVLPSGLPLVNSSPPPDAVTLPMLRWSLGDMLPGERRTVVITTTAPSTFGVITNTALLDARQRLVTQTVFATQVITQGTILRVSKTGSAPRVDVGDQLIYTLRYENAGNVTGTMVTLTDTFPSGIVVDATNPSTGVLPTNQSVWSIGELVPDQTGQVIITTTVGGSGGRTLVNVADITGQPGSFPEHAVLETDVNLRRIYLPLVFKAHN